MTNPHITEIKRLKEERNRHNCITFADTMIEHLSSKIDDEKIKSYTQALKTQLKMIDDLRDKLKGLFSTAIKHDDMNDSWKSDALIDGEVKELTSQIKEAIKEGEG